MSISVDLEKTYCFFRRFSELWLNEKISQKPYSENDRAGQIFSDPAAVIESQIPVFVRTSLKEQE